MDQKKILFISDIQIAPSGVANQSRYLIEGLLAKKKNYLFRCFGATKESDFKDGNVIIIDKEKYGEDWKILPMKGYGNPRMIRDVLIQEKPDLLFFFTDPRFYVWLWEIENEIRHRCPMMYWHVWDNTPSPEYNKAFYDSTDCIVAISKKTECMLHSLGYNNKTTYIPHAVDKDIFKILDDKQIFEKKEFVLGSKHLNKFIFFWNNRNARRKMTGTVVMAFSMFLEKLKEKFGHTNALLLMHTDSEGEEGQNIGACVEKYKLLDNVVVSNNVIQREDINMFCNISDAVVNISNAEGFGLSVLESLMTGTPVIVNMTGGLQYQIGDWWIKHPELIDDSLDVDLNRLKMLYGNNVDNVKWYGIPIFPVARSLVGSQVIPYIYEDVVSATDVSNAMFSMFKYKMSNTVLFEKEEIRKWACDTFNMDNMINQFDFLIENTISNFKKNKNSFKRFETFSL